MKILYEIRTFSSEFQMKIGNTGGVYINLDILSFSDHIIISAPLNVPSKLKLQGQNQHVFGHWLLLNFIKKIALLYQLTLPLGVALRGAMAVGDIYYDAKSNIIIGEPLIEAIEDEQKTAIYPRVIISQSCLDFFNLFEHNYVSYFQLLRRDFDGIYIIDYLGEIFSPRTGEEINIETIRNIRNIIEENINNSKNLQISAKWHWVANYFDIALNNCQYFNRQDTKNIPEKINNFNLLAYNLENRAETFKNIKNITVKKKF